MVKRMIQGHSRSRSADDKKGLDKNEFFNFESGVPTHAPNTVEMVEGTKENFSDDQDKFKLLLVDVEKPLYK